MWTLLRDRRFCGLKFRRQAHVHGFIADFACFELQLVIEMAGSIHNEPAKAASDGRRDALLAEQGWRTVRIANMDLLNDPVGTLAKLRPAVGTSG